MRKLLSLLLGAGFLTQVAAQTNPEPQTLPFDLTGQTGSQLLHGKANTGNVSEQVESWHRRKDGAAELKDSLDKYYPYSNVVILGDFNDELDQTIAPSIPGNTSSYIDFLNDGSVYKPLTLPLSLAGQRSTVSHDNAIDHQVASSAMGVAYVPGSVKASARRCVPGARGPCKRIRNRESVYW